MYSSRIRQVLEDGNEDGNDDRQYPWMKATLALDESLSGSGDPGYIAKAVSISEFIGSIFSTSTPGVFRSKKWTV